MRLLATIAAISLAASSFTASSIAQKPTTFSDPANLRGERVKPRDSRELPIDGGEGHNALGLEQLLRKLNTRASILNIVAHPDDEDGGMLTFYSRGMGARVADISLTRGEGGQNAATGDFEDALGLLRTQELLANDRYTGVDQMFGTEVDFGFSKTKTEAFAKWTHERVLYDVVRAIRLYRPLVLTATFIGGPTDGHGQHQVSGEIAQEAFLAAGDPKVFPELTAEGILPWQPLRMYARVPRQSISDKGLFDYATGQYVPAEFTNYVTGKTSTTSPTADVIVHEGATDPLLTTCAANPADLPETLSSRSDCHPLSYVQFARIGLSLQKSQIGPGARRARAGAYDVAYHLYGDKTNPTSTPAPKDTLILRSNATKDLSSSATSAQPSNTSDPNFFTGIDTSIEGIGTETLAAFPPLESLLHDLSQKISAASSAFNPAKPEAIAPQLKDALITADSAISAVQEFKLGTPYAKENVLHDLRVKRVQLNQALVLSLGLHLDATLEASLQPKASATYPNMGTQQPRVPQGSNIYLISRFDNGDPNVAIDSYTYKAPAKFLEGMQMSPVIGPCCPHHVRIFENTLAISSDARLTKPYFSRANIEQPLYDLSDEALRSASQTPSPIIVYATAIYGAAQISLATIVEGSSAQPLSIVPQASVSLSTHEQVLSTKEDSFELTAAVNPPTTTPKLQFPTTWQQHILPTTANCEGCTAYSIAVPASDRKAATIQASARINGAYFTEGYRPVGYGSLPRTNFYTHATDRIVPVDLNLPTHHHIAYLPGTGDAVPSALASIGLAPTILTVRDLTSDNLKQYDTVILGVRTYNAHPDLHGAPTRALLDYARNGGNVVVQYQTLEFTGADAPYPLDLGTDEKVVDETAPVALLNTTNPLLTTPNKITSADFDNWIEERGHGFLSTWDEHYTALTETHDPGAPSEHVAPQLPQRGGLITVQLGKGRWTYCAFALYRQLPEAVPGAYRLFMNLINP